MKTFKWMSLAVLAAAAIGCDPYDDVKSGAATLLSATAADLTNHVAYSANASGSSVTIDITCEAVAEQLCFGIDPTDVDADELSDLTDLTDLAVFITFDRQIDGTTVQSTLDDCTPTGGWLTVSASPGAGNSWYSCYSPSSPSPGEGGSAVVFTAPTAAPPATVAGWDEDTRGAYPAAPAPVTFSGTVGGQAVNVTLNRVDVATCDTAALCGT